MHEAGWDQQLVAVLETEFNADPLSEIWRAVPDIYGHIVERTSSTAHQLCLGMRRGLKVQATQGVGCF